MHIPENVQASLQLWKYLSLRPAVVAACPAAALTRDVMNEQAVLGCRRAGDGLFIRALDRQLRRRGLTVPALEHDLAAELAGTRQSLLAVPPVRVLGVRARRR